VERSHQFCFLVPFPFPVRSSHGTDGWTDKWTNGQVEFITMVMQ